VAGNRESDWHQKETNGMKQGTKERSSKRCNLLISHQIQLSSSLNPFFTFPLRDVQQLLTFPVFAILIVNQNFPHKFHTLSTEFPQLLPGFSTAFLSFSTGVNESMGFLPIFSKLPTRTKNSLFDTLFVKLCNGDQAQKPIPSLDVF
jgi:hypothetical protein